MSRCFPSVATVALGAAVLLTGCAGLEDLLGDIGRQEPRTVAYACAAEREFVARFSAERDEVRIRADDDEEYELALAARENGRRVYSDDDNAVRLTVDGDAAYLRIPGGPDLQGCMAER